VTHITYCSAECHCAECLYAEFCYAGCHYAECHYTEWHYPEWHYAVHLMVLRRVNETEISFIKVAFDVKSFQRQQFSIFFIENSFFPIITQHVVNQGALWYWKYFKESVL
jgi:hypothetical protein